MTKDATLAPDASDLDALVVGSDIGESIFRQLNAPCPSICEHPILHRVSTSK